MNFSFKLTLILLQDVEGHPFNIGLLVEEVPANPLWLDEIEEIELGGGLQLAYSICL
jgi:hypothetical protein